LKFFSGHYKCYGLYIQAVCDHNSRFTYFAVAAPGSSSDREALLDTNLPAMMEKVPDGFALIGDPAYEATEKMVPIYYGISELNPETDNGIWVNANEMGYIMATNAV
jgi:DDE superfamily endonuclease